MYILRHLCVYPKPTIDLYIETRLPDCSAIDGSAPGAAGRRKRSDTEPVEASLDKVFDPAKKLKYENIAKAAKVANEENFKKMNLEKSYKSLFEILW